MEPRNDFTPLPLDTLDFEPTCTCRWLKHFSSRGFISLQCKFWVGVVLVHVHGVVCVLMQVNHAQSMFPYAHDVHSVWSWIEIDQNSINALQLLCIQSQCCGPKVMHTPTWGRPFGRKCHSCVHSVNYWLNLDLFKIWIQIMWTSWRDIL